MDFVTALEPHLKCYSGGVREVNKGVMQSLQDGVMVEWLVLLPHCSKVPCLNLPAGCLFSAGFEHRNDWMSLHVSPEENLVLLCYLDKAS